MMKRTEIANWMIMVALSATGVLAEDATNLAARAQAESLRVRIASAGPRMPNYLMATIENMSESSLRILKPVGGSEWPGIAGLGAVEPAYQVDVETSAGGLLPVKGHCKVVGPFENTQWPDDYLVMLMPGESITTKVYIPRQVPAEGAYLVRLTYRYTGRGHASIPALAGLPVESLWKGEVQSPLTPLVLSKSTPGDLGTRTSRSLPLPEGRTKD